MAILAGIDEAGYGPLLGPLVVSSAVFEIPEDNLKADMWDLLADAAGRTRGRLAGRLLVADSKKAYNSSTGVTHLRRTVLAFLAAAGVFPSNAQELVGALCPQCAKRLDDYPWHSGLLAQSLMSNPDDISIACAVLKKAMNAKDIRFGGLSSRCLDVAYYNRMVTAVRNKATVLFTAVASLIKQAYDDAAPGQTVQVIVDRQGGRADYSRTLCTMFEGLELKILRQSEGISSYELTGADKKMRIHFATAADDRYLPVSLASMTSKYVRQVLMESLNQYFVSRCNGLKPTAGYWTDGQRFIKELQSHPTKPEVDNNKLIRCR